MIIRSSNQLSLGVRWVSRIALTFAILACGGSSEDSSIGTRGGALSEATDTDATSTEAVDLLGDSNDAAAATGSCVSDGDDSDSDELDDSDDSASDDDDSVDDDADEVDDDEADVASAADVDKSAADDDADSDGDDADSDGDDADSDGDDADSDGDDADSDGDDCVPAPEAPAADPSSIQ